MVTDMKIALVTGGAKRVGRAICLALADKNYALAIHHNHSDADAEKLRQEIIERGGQAACVKADLSDADATQGVIRQTTDALGAPTCLINNASSFDHDTGASFTAQDWDRQMAINLRAPALLCRDFAAAVPASMQGCIVNILDQKIARPTPGFYSYTLSKLGLEALTQLAAQAYAPDVRVCAVAPGLTLPSGTQSQAQFDEAHGQTLLGKGATLEAIADAVLYLVSADQVTGQVIYVDGGERFSPQSHDETMI